MLRHRCARRCGRSRQLCLGNARSSSRRHACPQPGDRERCRHLGRPRRIRILSFRRLAACVVRTCSSGRCDRSDRRARIARHSETVAPSSALGSSIVQEVSLLCVHGTSYKCQQDTNAARRRRSRSNFRSTAFVPQRLRACDEQRDRGMLPCLAFRGSTPGAQLRTCAPSLPLVAAFRDRSSRRRVRSEL